MTQRLRNHRDDGTLHAGARQRVLQRLLNHVAHPSRRARDQHAKRKGLDLIAGDLVARQLVADLRSISMNQDDVPRCGREVHDRRETRPRVVELIADRRPLAGWRDGVSSEGDDDRSRGRHGGAT